MQAILLVHLVPTGEVVDVKVEGVSMTQTLSSDFTSIIRQKDGQVSGLIVELEKKTAQLSAN